MLKAEKLTPATPTAAARAAFSSHMGAASGGGISEGTMKTFEVRYEVYSFVFAEAFGFVKTIKAESSDAAISEAMRQNSLGERFSARLIDLKWLPLDARHYSESEISARLSTFMAGLDTGKIKMEDESE